MSSTPPAGPSFRVKLLVSVLVVAQFFVIFSVVTSAGSPDFPPSPPARHLGSLTKPYAQALFLNNAYRFFAPNPGATNLLWVRFHYKDGSSRWKELPRLEDFASRIPYQRNIALMLMMGMTGTKVVVSSEGKEGPEALADPLASMRTKYSPLGRVCVQSFVRHLARLPEYAQSYGTGAPLENMELYHILHTIPSPDHTKLGWRYEDPRLYEITYVGTYALDGQLLPGESEYLQTTAADEFFALRLVERDLLDYLDRFNVNTEDSTALAEALERFGIPSPFRWVVLKNRNLLQPQGRDQLRKLYEQTLLDDEIPGARARIVEPPRIFTPPQTPQPPDKARASSTAPRMPPLR